MDERPPYEAYAAIMGAFFGGLAATGLLARALGREPREHDALDLLTLVAANFKAARTLAHDEVTSFLREPFVQGYAHEGAEEPEHGGTRQAVGELVTCTRCIGTWTAAGLAATQVLWPRFGRILTWTLSAAAVNDFLQSAFVAMAEKANEIEARG
jgi:hypothetical protein